ncbi:MAG: pyruvate kinase [Agathobaculum sp.]|jgi:pyruvate kinase|uniref:pyruvate kinase n=1 Tax=Agathobaculum sp. TaxID=2048138 RepID=UPI003D8B77F6
MRKTKIICTLGPATDAVLPEMIKAGMNVARMNFSHGSHEEHKARMDAVKAARAALGMPVGIMLDTKGPEIRTKTYKDGKIEIADGQLFTLTTRDIEGDNTIVSITYEGLPNDVKPGTRILIDDGLVAFEVVEIKDGTDIVCRALNAGPLSNRKSINVPGIKLNMQFVSEKDRADIEFGLTQDIDFIAASFTRCAQDVRDIKAILKAHGKEDVEIIAKIENMEGVNNIQEILDEASGVMVARGDLGVEVPFEELPEIQKFIIKTCISRGKRVVTATQMLESMAKNPRPTRAEVSDVANAVYDGTSAIMLSGETSVGKYPVDTVATMSRIAENAESTIHYDRRRTTRLEFQNMNLTGDLKTIAIAHATCSTTADLGAKCIVAFTESGSTARSVSTYRPGAPIIGATPCEKTFHRLTMSWGVMPVMVPRRPSSGTELYDLSERAAVSAVDLRVGDVITVTAGMPVGKVNYTNTLRVHQLTEHSFAHLAQD